MNTGSFPLVAVRAAPPLRWLGLILQCAGWLGYILVLLVALEGCGPTWRPVATVTVVTVGGGLAVVQGEHQRVYTRATDALIERLRAAGGTMADYDREAAPLTRAFRARGDAIQGLDAQLYAAAAVIAAAAADDLRAWVRAAARILATIRQHLGVLEDGTLLPAVPIPREITDTVAVLEQIAGAFDGRGGAHAR
jgi:hypothetical protein